MSDNASQIWFEPVNPEPQAPAAKQEEEIWFEPVAEDVTPDVPGNIDLFAQPKVKNPAGGTSTVYSRSFNIDGKEYLLPSVTPDRRFLASDDEIIAEFRKTGRHLGAFSSPEAANKFAEKLHSDYESGKYDDTKPAFTEAGFPTNVNSVQAEMPLQEFTESGFPTAASFTPPKPREDPTRRRAGLFDIDEAIGQTYPGFMWEGYRARRKQIFDELPVGGTMVLGVERGDPIRITKSSPTEFISAKWEKMFQDDDARAAFAASALKSVPSTVAGLKAASMAVPVAQLAADYMGMVPGGSLPAKAVRGAGKVVKYTAPVVAGVSAALGTRIGQEKLVESNVFPQVSDLYRATSEAEARNPLQSRMGNLAPQLAFFSPGNPLNVDSKVVPAVTGGLGAAIDAVTQYMRGEKIDWSQVVESGLAAGILNRETRWGAGLAPNLVAPAGAPKSGPNFQIYGEQAAQRAAADAQARVNQGASQVDALFKMEADQIRSQLAGKSVDDQIALLSVFRQSRDSYTPQMRQMMDVLWDQLEREQVNAKVDQQRQNAGVPRDPETQRVDAERLRAEQEAAFVNARFEQERLRGAQPPETPREIPQVVNPAQAEADAVNARLEAERRGAPEIKRQQQIEAQRLKAQQDAEVQRLKSEQEAAAVNAQLEKERLEKLKAGSKVATEQVKAEAKVAAAQIKQTADGQVAATKAAQQAEAAAQPQAAPEPPKSAQILAKASKPIGAPADSMANVGSTIGGDTPVGALQQTINRQITQAPAPTEAPAQVAAKAATESAAPAQIARPAAPEAISQVAQPKTPAPKKGPVKGKGKAAKAAPEPPAGGRPQFPLNSDPAGGYFDAAGRKVVQVPGGWALADGQPAARAPEAAPAPASKPAAEPATPQAYKTNDVVLAKDPATGAPRMATFLADNGDGTSRVRIGGQEQTVDSGTLAPKASAGRTSDKVIAALEKAKISKPGRVMSDATGLATAYDASIDVAIAAIKAGRAAPDAISEAVAHFRKQFPNATDEDVARLVADIPNALARTRSPAAAAGAPEQIVEGAAVPVQTKEHASAVRDAFKFVRETNRANPEAVPLRIALNKHGHPKMKPVIDEFGNPVLDRNGKPKLEVEYEGVRYGLRNAPGLSKYDEVAVQQASDLVMNDLEKAFKYPSVVAGSGWYARFREVMQRMFGASNEVFGQLLGATSARTPVETNFSQSIDALRNYSKGMYDDLLKRYHQHVMTTREKAMSGELQREWKQRNPGKRDSEFKLNSEYRKAVNSFREIPLRENGMRYSMNSKKVLQALYGNWIEQTLGPKTPNYAGNLTGRTFDATIDVWAARFLRRILYSGKTKKWRLHPKQEGAVEYTLDKDGNYGGDFVFGQNVFAEVANRLGMAPDDLQAIAWFWEKHLWDENGWTGSAGAEKSDLNLEAQHMQTRRYQVGLTTARPNKYGTVKDMQRQRASIKGVIAKHPDVLASRVTHSNGSFMNEPELALDVEFTLKRSGDPYEILQTVVNEAKIADQDATFISKIVDKDHPNARPIMEIGFKRPASQAEVNEIMRVFQSNDIDGFTMARDPQGRVIGIRTQYIPEFAGNLDPAVHSTESVNWTTKARNAKAALDQTNISHATEGYASTHVFSREEYDAGIPRDIFGRDVASELGRRRDVEAQRAAAQRAVSGGDAQANAAVRPGDAGANAPADGSTGGTVAQQGGSQAGSVGIGSQRGSANVGAMIPIASGFGGAAYGITQGETAEERVKNALLYAGLAAAGGSMVARAGTALAKRPKVHASPILNKVDRMLTPIETKRSMIQRAQDAYGRFRFNFNTKAAPIGIAQRALWKAAGMQFTPNRWYDLERTFERISGAPVQAEREVAKLQAIMDSVPRENAEDVNRYLVLARINDRLTRMVDENAALSDAVGRAQAELDLARDANRSNPGIRNATAVVTKKAELDKAVKRMNDEFNRKRVGDWSVTEARQGLADLESELGATTFAAIQRASQDYQKLMSDVLREQVAAGRMKQDLFDRIIASNDFYAPFKVLKYFENEEGFVRGGGTQRIPSSEQLAKKITGIDDLDVRLDAPINTSAEQIYKGHILAQKNLLMQQVATLADIDPKGDFVRKVSDDAQARPGYEMVNYFENGVLKRLEVSKQIAAALTGATNNEAAIILNGMKRFGSAFKMGATGLSIPFNIANAFVFDPLRLATISRYGFRGPQDFLYTMYEWPYALYSSLRGNVGQAIGMKPNELYETAALQGVLNSTMARSMAPEAFKSRMSRDLKLGDAVGENNFHLGVPIKIASLFSSTLEESTKLLGLKRAMRLEKIDQLPPDKRAQKWAEIVTEVRNYAGSPDFRRVGVSMKPLNVILPFLNPRWQGAISDMARLNPFSHGNKKDATAAWARLGTLVVTPAAALTVYNLMPENRKDYEQIPEKERDRYFHIPLWQKEDGEWTLMDTGNPYRFKNRDGVDVRGYFRIPKREVSGMLANMTEATIKYMRDENPEGFGDLAAKFGEEALKTASPLNLEGNTIGERAFSAASGLNPAVRVPLELGFNKNMFTGRPIVPMGTETGYPEDQYDKRTPEAYKSLANALPDWAPDVMRSPAKLQHGIEGFTGGFTRQFMPPKVSSGNPVEEVSPLMSRFFRSENLESGELDEAGDVAMRERTSQRLKAQRTAEQLAEVIFAEPDAGRRNKLFRDAAQAGLINEEVYGYLKEDMQDLQRGLTYEDRTVKRKFSVAGGFRARYFLDKVAGMEPDAARAYLQDQYRKGVLSKEVLQQMNAQKR